MFAIPRAVSGVTRLLAVALEHQVPDIDLGHHAGKRGQRCRKITQGVCFFQQRHSPLCGDRVEEPIKGS